MHPRRRRVDDDLGRQFYLDQNYFLMVHQRHQQMCQDDMEMNHLDVHQLRHLLPVRQYLDVLVDELRNLDEQHQGAIPPLVDAHRDAMDVVLVGAELHHRSRMDCYLGAVDEASRLQDLFQMRMDYFLGAVGAAFVWQMHHHRLLAPTKRLAQQVLLAQPAQLQQLRLVQPVRLLTVHEYRHQASRAPLQSLRELGRRSSWQRTSSLQLSLRAWEHRRYLLP
jgi:hypothetical protein